MLSRALESKFSLPNDEKIKTELIGEWYSEKNNDERIKITKNGEKSYAFQIIDKNETEELNYHRLKGEGFGFRLKPTKVCDYTVVKSSSPLSLLS